MDPHAHDISADDGTRLRVWGLEPSEADEAVLFLHGAITSSRALFAPPVPGDDSYSWLHAAANAGRATFALDVRGYGESERPPEMDEPPEANDPPVRSTVALQDVRAAYEFVAERHDAVHLVGVSWGTMNAGTFLERENPEIASLVQCAPVYRPPYDFEPGLEALGLEPDFGAWYEQDRETVEARQGSDELSPVFEAVWRTQVESNQGIDGRDAYIAQTGALADWRDGCLGEPVYDPAAIEVPTLVVRGSADATSAREDALSLYDELELASDRAEYAEIDGADHYPMHGHRRRTLFDVVSKFQDRI